MSGMLPTPESLPIRRLPPPGRAALLLDMDGTLLDIAPTPDLVVVEEGLSDVLSRLRAHLGDALAIVTGRPVEQVDALFPGIPYAVAGEHGGAIRAAPDATVTRIILPDPPVEWVVHAAEIVEQVPGALLEQKQRGFVLHYRLAPDAGPALLEAARGIIAGHQDQFQVIEASMAWEIRPRGADKGSAVQTLMLDAPFLGRAPIFIGDDVTDEDGIRAARALSGDGLRVHDVFQDSSGVRAWLARSADGLDKGETGWADW